MSEKCVVNNVEFESDWASAYLEAEREKNRKEKERMSKTLFGRALYTVKRHLKSFFWGFEARDYVLLLLIGVVSHGMGYYTGAMDSYVEGYNNAKAGIYEEQPSFEQYSSFIGTGKYLGNKLCIFIKNQFLFLENVPNADVECVQGNGKVTEREYKATHIALAEIPSSILNRFIADDCKIILQEDNIWLENYGGNDYFLAAGTWSPSSKTITLHANVSNIRENLSHEIGHYFEDAAGYVSESDEWNEIHQREWKGLYREEQMFHTVGTKSEYFAECFKLYVTKPEKLAKICPESYAFIEKTIAEFETK